MQLDLSLPKAQTEGFDMMNKKIQDNAERIVHGLRDLERVDAEAHRDYVDFWNLSVPLADLIERGYVTSISTYAAEDLDLCAYGVSENLARFHLEIDGE